MLELENAKFLAEAATGALSNHMPAGHGDRSNAGRARLCSRAEQARRQYGGGASHQGRGRHQGVQADSITMAAESGGEITAQLLASTKILHVPPGEKDLKNATVLQAQDLHPGDRVLVRGQASADGHTIAALAVIVMTQADLSAKQQHDREDWQKRGVGGLVTKVDAAAASITISSGGMGASHSVVIHIAKNTILRRYAPDSVKFDDAKPAPAVEFMTQIKAGISFARVELATPMAAN